MSADCPLTGGCDPDVDHDHDPIPFVVPAGGSVSWTRTLDDGTDAGGNLVPLAYADGVREAFGVDLADLADDEDTAPGFVVPAWLEDGATLESFLITAEIDGKAHTMRAGFVHVDNLPFLGSDSPVALRALATHCAELADRLEARHTSGADL